jgi:NADP-dependent aldehyde dehydrogenase
MEGHLTATVHGTDADLREFAPLIAILEERVGRIVFNGFPTGVEVCPSMNHGGPYPATTDGKYTSVGTGAILRFVRPLSYQNFPDAALPQELRNKNVQKIWRLVDSKVTQDDL